MEHQAQRDFDRAYERHPEWTNHGGASVGFDIGAIRRVVHSKGSQPLSWKQTRMLSGFVCGSLPTVARLAGRRLGALNSKCIHGCEVVDDDFHRLWECLFGREARHASFMQEIIDQALAAGRGDPKFARGWFRVEPLDWEWSEEKYIYYIDGREVTAEAFPVFSEGAVLYLDGSYLYPTYKQLTFAGAAIVELDASLGVARAIGGRVAA